MLLMVPGPGNFRLCYTTCKSMSLGIFRNGSGTSLERLVSLLLGFHNLTPERKTMDPKWALQHLEPLEISPGAPLMPGGEAIGPIISEILILPNQKRLYLCWITNAEEADMPADLDKKPKEVYNQLLRGYPMVPRRKPGAKTLEVEPVVASTNRWDEDFMNQVMPGAPLWSMYQRTEGT
jgi:hypothetical protein